MGNTSSSDDLKEKLTQGCNMITNKKIYNFLVVGPTFTCPWTEKAYDALLQLAKEKKDIVVQRAVEDDVPSWPQIVYCGKNEQEPILIGGYSELRTNLLHHLPKNYANRLEGILIKQQHDMERGVQSKRPVIKQMPVNYRV